MRVGHIQFYGGIIALIAYIAFAFSAFNDYSNQHANYWDLADKSSSIEDKYIYIDKMVESLESSNLQGHHNALLYKNPSNNFDNNLKALTSLRDRLNEIKCMNVSSFEYQTAMSQITAQEQGEAEAMLAVIQGCWFKEHHFFLWNWIAVVIVIGIIVISCIGGYNILEY